MSVGVVSVARVLCALWVRVARDQSGVRREEKLLLVSKKMNGVPPGLRFNRL